MIGSPHPRYRRDLPYPETDDQAGDVPRGASSPFCFRMFRDHGLIYESSKTHR